MLAEVQGMSLIILDNKFAGSPRGLVDFLHEVHAVSLEGVCHRGNVVGLEVQVEVVAQVDEGDRRVLLVNEFEMKDLLTCPNARVEILVLKLQREPDLLGVKAN